jgi:hypothetical protein
LISRIPITDISPAVNFGGELVPVKAVAGEVIAVTATIFREGHDALGAHALLFDDKGKEIAENLITQSKPLMIPLQLGNTTQRSRSQPILMQNSVALSAK